MKRILLCSTLLSISLWSAGIFAQEVSKDTAGAARETEKPSRTPDVIFVPTPQEAVEEMLEMAEIKPGDVLYDLGCGDGRIVVTAAKKYGIKAYGFDIDPQRIKESKENARTNKVEHLVTFEQQDIFDLDLSKVDVVTLYLLPSLNVKLIPQLEKLKPGARIVSYSFDMQGVEPVQVVEEPHLIYKWKAPIQRDLREP